MLYIADGVTVRAVDQRGRIVTLIGSHSSSSSWRPLLCYQTVPASQVCVWGDWRGPTTRRSFPRDAFPRDDAQGYVSARCDSRAETYPCETSRGI